MKLGNRCTLCGGRLDRSRRCTECGLDNTKNDSMYKHMINKNDCENKPLTHVHEESKANKKNGKVTYTYNNYREEAKPTVRRVQKKKGGIVGIIIVIVMILSSVVPALFSIIEDLSYGMFEEAIPEYEYTPEEDFLFEDELNYEYMLGRGYYEIGVHLPEGEYEISMDSGEYAGVGLYEFDGESWGLTQDWNFAVSTGQTVHEVWFEEGDIIVISTNEDLRFTTLWTEGIDTDNEIYVEENETYFVSGTVVVGEDIPTGVYDMIISSDSQLESGFVILEQHSFCGEGGELPIYFGPEIGEEYYFNAPLTPGTVITVKEGLTGIHLIPSYVVGPAMYDMTWGMNE